MTSAIMNPLHKEDMDAIRSANTLNGHDPDCRQWLTANRPAGAEGEARRTAARRTAPVRRRRGGGVAP
jgi:5-methyltetrahydrofolate--homocysteine methyltransferase